MADKWKYDNDWVTKLEAACATALDAVCRPIAEQVAARARAGEDNSYGARVYVVKATRLKRGGGKRRQAGYGVIAAGSRAAAIEAKRGTLARALRGA